MNCAQWFVRTLKDRGVEQVFVLCGNGLNAFLDACLDQRMTVIDVRNEQAAAYMADLWGAMTGKLGVVAVSSGPGHTNALTGLANAAWDGRPMMLVSGCSDTRTLGLGHFQELDQIGMAAPVCKRASFVGTAANIKTETDLAIAAAVSGRPGPVHLTIPEDVLSAPVDQKKMGKRSRQPAEVVQSSPGDPALVRDAVELLAGAKRPLMVVGSGAFYAKAGRALERFAKQTNIPIISQLWDRCCVEKVMPQYIGVSTEELNESFPLVAKSDVVLVLGTRVDYRLGYGKPPVFSPNVRFVRVDYDPNEIDHTIQPEVGIVGDVRSVLEQMLEEAKRLKKWANEAWLARMRKPRDRSIQMWENMGHENTHPLPGFRICLEIKKFLKGDTTFLLDGGNIGRWAHTLLYTRHPSHWATCGISGVIGWGLPGAMVSNLIRPGKPVLLLSGDGSAGFTITEIETALRFGTPYVAVIAHDSAWGIVVDGQPKGRQVASHLGEIRFDKVAEALGARGVFIEHPSQLEPAIAEGLKLDTVTVIHVPTMQVGIRKWDLDPAAK